MTNGMSPSDAAMALAASHEVNELDAVALADRRVGETFPREDLAIQLDDHHARMEVELM